MSKFYAECPCGGKIELSGWGIREFDFQWWIDQHIACTPAGEHARLVIPKKEEHDEQHEASDVS